MRFPYILQHTHWQPAHPLVCLLSCLLQHLLVGHLEALQFQPELQAGILIECSAWLHSSQLFTQRVHLHDTWMAGWRAGTLIRCSLCLCSRQLPLQCMQRHSMQQ